MPFPANDLKRWRYQLGVSRAELVRLLGIDPSTLQRWEAGHVAAPHYLQAALAEHERRLRRGVRADRVARAKRIARRRAADPSDPRYW